MFSRGESFRSRIHDEYALENNKLITEAVNVGVQTLSTSQCLFQIIANDHEL